MTEEYLLLTADMEHAPLEHRFEIEQIESARAIEAAWKKDPLVFNVALWKINVTKNII